jgi:hypothetical protein
MRAPDVIFEKSIVNIIFRNGVEVNKKTRYESGMKPSILHPNHALNVHLRTFRPKPEKPPTQPL